MGKYVKTQKIRTSHKVPTWRIITVCSGLLLLGGGFAYLSLRPATVGQEHIQSASSGDSAIVDLESSSKNGRALEEMIELAASPTSLHQDSEPAPPAALDSSDLQKILFKHWEAMGGMSNWSKIESIRLNGTIERNNQLVDICIVKKRPNQIRATVTLPIPGSEDEALQVIRAHDGKTAWTATRLAGAPEMVKEELPPEAAAELLADAGVLPPLIKLWREGAEFELLESKVVQGENAYTFRTKTAASPQYTFYLSTDSHQLLAYDSVYGDGTTTRTTITDFVKEAGVLVPRKSIIEFPTTGISTLTMHSVEVGIGIYKEYFGPGESPRTAQSE